MNRPRLRAVAIAGASCSSCSAACRPTREKPHGMDRAATSTSSPPNTGRPGAGRRRRGNQVRRHRQPQAGHRKWSDGSPLTAQDFLGMFNV